MKKSPSWLRPCTQATVIPGLETRPKQNLYRDARNLKNKISVLCRVPIHFSEFQFLELVDPPSVIHQQVQENTASQILSTSTVHKLSHLARRRPCMHPPLISRNTPRPGCFRSIGVSRAMPRHATHGQGPTHAAPIHARHATPRRPSTGERARADVDRARLCRSLAAAC